MARPKRVGAVDEPVMSDLTILVSVEDLINIAMGPAEKNVVNFKMVQSILHILARQLRLLETQVELRISEGIPVRDRKRSKKRSDRSSSSPSSSASPKRDLQEIKEEKKRKAKEKGEDNAETELKAKEKAEKNTAKEKELLAKLTPEEKEQYLKEKEEMGIDKMTPKEKEQYLKQKEKEQKEIEKMSPKEKEKYMKEKEKQQQEMKNMSPKEKEKYLKNKYLKEKEHKDGEEISPAEKEKARLEEKELKEMEKMSPKEKEKYFKEKEQKKLEKMSPKEKEKYLKEKEKEQELMEKMSPKEKEKYLKQKEKEQKEIEKMSPKEKEKYDKEKEKEQELLEKMSPKEKEKYLKEKEKEQKELEKMSPKEKEKYHKEKEKERKELEKMSPKEKEKYLKEKEIEIKELGKMSPKEKEKYLKEKDKENEQLEKMSPQAREKFLKEKENEREQLEQMSPKQREKYLKEKSTAQMKHPSRGVVSGSSIAVSEVERHKEKVLVVEKGPTTRSASKTRVGSIEVVTLSQFEMLKATVKELQKVAGPLPLPALPDNKKLRSDLAQGNASLTDTMKAMQVTARVQAAEQAITRMAGLLTQLAAAGALPSELAGQLEDVTTEIEALKHEATTAGEQPSKAAQSTAAMRKSVAISAMSSAKQSRMDASTSVKPSSVAVSAYASGAVSVTSKPSRVSKVSVGLSPPVTRNDMDDAIQSMKDDMLKHMYSITTKASSSAENASCVAKAVSDKLDVALKLNRRINDLFSLTSDYAEQLTGFDAGLTTQMQSFQEQMVQMRSDLKGGMEQLEMVNNNAETAAVMELNDRFLGLVRDLEGTMSSHQHLTSFQKTLNEELRSLLQAVEMLREQKADRDEVFDGLRDKADNSKLAGLLSEDQFATSRQELDRRLNVCYDKFRRQEAVWMGALKDLAEVLEGKAEIMQLLTLKDDAQDEMRDIQAKLDVLSIQLGEPKAAILTRLLSKDGKCAACNLPSLMDPQDVTANIPPSLPALRPPPDGEPAEPQWQPLMLEDPKEHTCKRWVGGSHTLLPVNTPREVAPTTLLAGGTPVTKYAGCGLDGRLYRMEDELLPCIECNRLTTDDVEETQMVTTPEKDTPRQDVGAGDTPKLTTKLWCPCIPE